MRKYGSGFAKASHEAIKRARGSRWVVLEVRTSPTLQRPPPSVGLGDVAWPLRCLRPRRSEHQSIETSIVEQPWCWVLERILRTRLRRRQGRRRALKTCLEWSAYLPNLPRGSGSVLPDIQALMSETTPAGTPRRHSWAERPRAGTPCRVPGMGVPYVWYRDGICCWQ